MTPNAAIEANNLTKKYGGSLVLDGVAFALPPGSKTALTGANGAGKSTLLHVLATLVSPTSGTATIAGYSITEALPALRGTIGMLTHSPMVYEELSPLENLRFFARLYGVPNPDARIEALLRAVGLWQRRDELTGLLSRGTHQRLAIARALVHTPSVLLLDEPETGLDSDGIAVLDALMLRAPHLTVLAATHLLARIDAWADSRLHLARGRVAAEASPVMVR